jgi:acetolactate synthase I/II/III large subunit
MAQMSGGDVIARMLHEEGVEKVFGIIDGTYFGFYSSLRNYGIELISPRHETCAAHMAGAYARLTGKLGVCMASNGPGVANILPGVAVENGEGNRVLLITSTRRVGIGYPDRGGTFQYFNQVGVTKPMSKWSGCASSYGRIPEMMKRAFRISWRGRPGVVHVDVPEDIINGKSDAPAGFLKPSQYRMTEPLAPTQAQIDAAAELLIKAEQPLIHAGSGIIHALAFDELQRVAELLQAPVCTSWAARGCIRENQSIGIPMLHVDLNHEVRNAADVVLTIGSRLGETDWWGKAPYWRLASDQKMIQVDIDEELIGLNKPVDLAVMADARVFLAKLGAALEIRKAEIPVQKRQEALKRFDEHRDKNRKKLDKHFESMETPMGSAHVPIVAQQVFDKDAIMIVDGGNAAIWSHFFSEARTPNAIMATPKFGMLGAGVSQALAAKVVFPERQVYCIIGDGAMGFHQQEVETAVRNKLNVIYMVLCDKQWGMVKMNQQFALRPFKTMIAKSLGPEETINADFSEVKFDKLAEAMGAHGERVSDPKELKSAIERCIAASKPAVIHVDVDPVKHMWAPNLLDFKKMHQEPKGK